MDEPIEQHDIMEHTPSVVDETYVTPVASRDVENVCMEMDTVAERMPTARMSRDKPTRNFDGVDVAKPATDAGAWRKLQIFCLVLLVMLVISSVTIGLLVNTLMQRTDELQLKISELQNRPAVEPVTTYRDLNNSLSQLETKVKSLGVAVSNISLDTNRMSTDLEKAHNSLANLSGRVTVNEIEIQADSSIIEANQQRISRLAMDNNATNSLYQTMEFRLNYMEDGLNCTWGNWTTFTSCSATCGDGIQYRERSLEGIDKENSRQWCARTETDLQACNIQPCKPVNGGWGKWAPFSNCSRICDGGNQIRVRVCDNPEPAYGGAPCPGNKEETQTCNIDPCPYPEDCSGFTAGNRIDGVYNISPNKSLTESVPVYCEFSSDGAWTVKQKRYDGSVGFNRTWQEYKGGFGDVNGEYWLGNDAIHDITSQGNYRLKIRLTDWDNVTKLANYTTFRISNESENYRLNIGGYSGDAGNAMAHHYGSQFSTTDRDNDGSSVNCAEVRGRGGWWYDHCGQS